MKDREAGVMQSVGSERVRHDLATKPHNVNNNKYVYYIYIYTHTHKLYDYFFLFFKRSFKNVYLFDSSRVEFCIWCEDRIYI